MTSVLLLRKQFSCSYDSTYLTVLKIKLFLILYWLTYILRPPTARHIESPVCLKSGTLEQTDRVYCPSQSIV